MAVPTPRRIQRRSLRGRLRRWFAGVGLVLVAVSATSMAFTIDSVNRQKASVVELNEIANLVHVRLATALVDERDAIKDYLLTRSLDHVLEFEAAEDAALEALTLLATFDRPELLALVGATRVAHDAWSDGWVNAALQRRGTGFSLEPAFVKEGEALLAGLEASTVPLNDYVAERQRLALAEAEEIGRNGIVLMLGMVVMLGLGAGAMGLTLVRSISVPLERLVTAVAVARETGRAQFDVGRPDEFGALGEALQALHDDLDARYDVARVEADRADLFSRLSERLSSTSDEGALTDAGAAAIRQLIPYVGGSISLLNPSSNRLTVVAAWGEGHPTVGERLVGPPDGCPAVRRSVPHIVRNGGDALVERCTIMPVGPDMHQGCLPMLATGKVIGVLHLDCPGSVEIDPAGPDLAQRVTEQLGLAIANARLTRTMERLAMSDSLTGLANALSFDSRVAELLRTAAAGKTEVGVIFLDLDHFKDFNDTYGHAAGDQALRAFGATITTQVREADVVARYGGEEFVIAIADAGLDATAAVAEKLRYAIEQMVVALGPGRYARVTASLGVAASDTHGFDAALLLRTADAALYTAKNDGRNRVVKALAPAAALGEAVPVAPSPPERRRGKARGALVADLPH